MEANHGPRSCRAHPNPPDTARCTGRPTRHHRGCGCRSRRDRPLHRQQASDTLATLATQGRVLRRPGAYQGGRRTPDRWTLISTATTRNTTAASPALPTTRTPQAAGVNRPRTAPGRLRAGQLRDLVEACLAQQPNQPESATAVAKSLDRSAGAVANALQVLVGQGRVLQAHTNPRRYVIAGTGDAAAASD